MNGTFNREMRNHKPATSLTVFPSVARFTGDHMLARATEWARKIADSGTASYIVADTAGTIAVFAARPAVDGGDDQGSVIPTSRVRGRVRPGVRKPTSV